MRAMLKLSRICLSLSILASCGTVPSPPKLDIGIEYLKNPKGQKMVCMSLDDFIKVNTMRITKCREEGF